MSQELENTEESAMDSLNRAVVADPDMPVSVRLGEAEELAHLRRLWKKIFPNLQLST